MKAVVQRVKRSSVTIDGKVVGEIGQGLMVLLGVSEDDTAVSYTHLTLPTICSV